MGLIVIEGGANCDSGWGILRSMGGNRRFPSKIGNYPHGVIADYTTKHDPCLKLQHLYYLTSNRSLVALTCNSLQFWVLTHASIQ